MIMKLTEKKCVPCEGGTAISKAEAERLLKEVSNWQLEEKMIRKQFKFKNFVDAIKFVNKVAAVAEAEGHHPDIKISWNKVTLELWTHAIDGLSENDFIVAAKVNAILNSVS